MSRNGVGSGKQKSLQSCAELSQCQVVNDTSRTVSGSEFHSSGPDTEKLLPYLANLIRGTARSPRVAERR